MTEITDGAVAPVTDSMTGRLALLGTATVSDALDKLRLPGSALGIAPLGQGQRMAGRAFTVRYVPIGAARGTVGDFLDDVPAGGVVVLDNGGRVDCTVWGDIMTAVAHARGIAGTVIDGVCRDTSRALGLGYPVYSRGRFMRTGKDRVAVTEIGGVVTLSDVQVAAGDVVLGDDDGVVVVPWSRAADVAAEAERIAEREGMIRDAAVAGERLAGARARYGYHQLQQASS